MAKKTKPTIEDYLRKKEGRGFHFQVRVSVEEAARFRETLRKKNLSAQDVLRASIKMFVDNG